MDNDKQVIVTGIIPAVKPEAWGTDELTTRQVEFKNSLLYFSFRLHPASNDLCVRVGVRTASKASQLSVSGFSLDYNIDLESADTGDSLASSAITSSYSVGTSERINSVTTCWSEYSKLATLPASVIGSDLVFKVAPMNLQFMSSEAAAMGKPDAWTESLERSVIKLLLTGHHSDVDIRVVNTEDGMERVTIFSVHSAILGSRSKVFDMMMDDRWSDGSQRRVVTVAGTDAAMVWTLLTYAYGAHRIDPTSAMPVLVKAAGGDDYWSDDKCLNELIDSLLEVRNDQMKEDEEWRQQQQPPTKQMKWDPGCKPSMSPLTSAKRWLGLLMLADRFQITGLMTVCENHMAMHIDNAEVACETLETLWRIPHISPTLVDAAMSYVIVHVRELLNGPSTLGLSADILSVVLERINGAT